MKDLSSELTVFVTTIGDQPNLNECRSCLERQTVKFTFELIDHVSPMSEAFNEMRRRCVTPACAQVDEDMLLFPHGIEQLFQQLESSSETVACVVAPLWDCQMERPIYGVKIYRQKVLREFAFRNTISCEVTLNEELAAAGYQVIRLPLRWAREACLGEHGKHYTPGTAYLRWRRLFEKRRQVGRLDWIVPWPRRFLERYAKTGSQIDLYSFLGAVVAITGEPAKNVEFSFEDPQEDFDHLVELIGTTGRHGVTPGEIRERSRAWKQLVKRWFSQHFTPRP